GPEESRREGFPSSRRFSVLVPSEVRQNHRPAFRRRPHPRAAIGQTSSKAVFRRNEQVFSGEALEAVLAAAQRPPSNEDSRTDRSLLHGGLRRSFVTMVVWYRYGQGDVHARRPDGRPAAASGRASEQAAKPGRARGGPRLCGSRRPPERARAAAHAVGP